MPAAALTPEADYRPLCLRCLRAGSVCLCSTIEPFGTFFDVVLLQHPKERKNSIGTARFTHLSLRNSRLVAGAEFDGHPEVEALLADPTKYAVVLFPGESAVNVSESRDAFLASIPGDSSGPKRLVIFVIDGTWSQARGMLRKSARLAALPRISFTLDRPSQYKVRKQPREFCLSTVEAVARLVKLLDPAAPSDRLLATFARMVDAQLECAIRGKEKQKHARTEAEVSA
ncbi:MAG: DTW domain-containing protein [Bdellovibrionales bacterium]|nr:DTW domain-containing protein [Bdellovibrionales bacterium]